MLADAATARTNLGLGTAATTAASDYATAAQGTKADTAHGWGNHSAAGYLTSFTETDPVFTAHAAYGIAENPGSGAQGGLQMEAFSEFWIRKNSCFSPGSAFLSGESGENVT